MSNALMRRTILSFGIALLTCCLLAQKPSANGKEKAAIQGAKNTLVSSLDRSLPNVSLEFFLSYEAGTAAIKWQVTDCLEQTGNPPTDHRSDSGMCVEADFEKDQIDVAVLVSVGSFEKGLSGVPAFFSASVTAPSGRRAALRRLADLPRELHRPVRGMPRDLPPSTTAFSNDEASGRRGGPTFGSGFSTVISAHVRDELLERLGVTYYPELRGCGVVGNRLRESRTALKAIRQEPTPEVGTLARSSDRSPGAADERKVQENDRVRRSKPNLDGVVRTQVTIHDPSIFRDKLLLHNRPLITRHCDKTWPPEDLIKLDGWEPGDLAQAPRESRFA